jgi:hypothetical protein
MQRYFANFLCSPFLQVSPPLQWISVTSALTRPIPNNQTAAKSFPPAHGLTIQHFGSDLTCPL